MGGADIRRVGSTHRRSAPDPGPAAPAPRSVEGPLGCRHRHRGGRWAVAVWAGASAVNLAIWAIVSLTTLSWIYPWWVWVAGPWGAMLLVNWLFRRNG